MTRTKGLALAFYFAAVAAGAAIGITVDRWVLRERLVRSFNDPGSMRDRFAADLAMDAAQRAQLDTILDARNKTYDALYETLHPQLDSIRDAARQRIRQTLRADQQVTFDRTLAARDSASKRERRK